MNFVFPATRLDFRILRYGLELPADIRKAMGKKMTMVMGENGLSLNCRVGRWVGQRDEDFIFYRPISVVFMKEERIVGYAKFVEWKMTHRLREHSFGYFMDSISHEAFKMAFDILKNWTLKSFAPQGRFTEWNELAIFNSADAKGWEILMREFIRRRYGNVRKTGGDVMLLKPFPLEFTGSVCSPEIEDVFERRRLAMIRMYEKKLGAQKLPVGEWMWIPLSQNPKKPHQRRMPVSLKDDLMLLDTA
jgi:hypothetical protein